MSEKWDHSSELGHQDTTLVKVIRTGWRKEGATVDSDILAVTVAARAQDRSGELLVIRLADWHLTLLAAMRVIG